MISWNPGEHAHRSQSLNPQWLVGSRFHFEALVTLHGEDNEVIQAFIWRVIGVPLVGGFDAALHDIQARWMGEDACADNPTACAALVEVLDLQDDDLQGDSA